MILIGQYDSPFVRRVAIAMRLYGIDYEHRPWSVFRDGGKIADYNPLKRVPTLVLDNGEVLIESTIILDYLDELAGPAKRLIAEKADERRRALKICALATGLADKSVSLIYERELHMNSSEVWRRRCRGQIAGVLDTLEADRERRSTAYWFGPSMTHADIAVACALRLLGDALPGLFDIGNWPHLTAHSRACEAQPIFKEISQPFIVTKE